MVKVTKDAQGKLTIQMDNLSEKEAWAVANAFAAGRYANVREDLQFFFNNALSDLQEQIPVITGETSGK